jgi:hypothetical protein
VCWSGKGEWKKCPPEVKKKCSLYPLNRTISKRTTQEFNVAIATLKDACTTYFLGDFFAQNFCPEFFCLGFFAWDFFALLKDTTR